MYGLIWGSTKLNKIKKKAKQRQKVSFCGIVDICSLFMKHKDNKFQSMICETDF